VINNIRRQLTLFLEEIPAENIETIRSNYNPRQRELINCHITLCREDEIENIGKVLDNLSSRKQKMMAIDFGLISPLLRPMGIFLMKEFIAR
jgi:hypothetical protein